MVDNMNNRKSNSALLSPLTPLPRRPQFQLLRQISAVVEANDFVSRFETLAGRSAMIGFSVALVVEVLAGSAQPSGLFGGAFTPIQAQSFLEAVIATVAASGMLAAASTRKLGATLTEPVIASLTAAFRSSSSISEKRVDQAVDYVLSTVFTAETLNTVTYDDIDSI